MQIIEISSPPRIKLNSYRPLCSNKMGREAIQKNFFPPYIDSSCRREPDFQNENPSISALCRGRKFAPTLKVGDIIIYMTKKGKYQPYTEKHRRLAAILQVEEMYQSHEAGKDAYERLGLGIPSNCMVEGNPPYELDKTGGRCSCSTSLDWDKDYKKRAKDHPCFIRTRKIYLNLENPTFISDDDLKNIFGKVPGTQNPLKTISNKDFVQLGRLAGIEFVFR